MIQCAVVSSTEIWLHHLKNGAFLYSKKNYPAAIDAFNKSIALNEHWNTYQGLGSALCHTGNYPAAIDAFNKSIALNEHWDTYQGLGFALSRTNNYRKALDAIINSYTLNRSKEIERYIYKIYLQERNGRDPDNTLMPFLENSISNKNQIAEICLKKYILDSSKTLQIDALLRHASLVTRDNIKKITKTTDTNCSTI